MRCSLIVRQKWERHIHIKWQVRRSAWRDQRARAGGGRRGGRRQRPRGRRRIRICAVGGGGSRAAGARADYSGQRGPGLAAQAFRTTLSPERPASPLLSATISLRMGETLLRVTGRARLAALAAAGPLAITAQAEAVALTGSNVWQPGGSGQGAYAHKLRQFKLNSFSAGRGGAGGLIAQRQVAGGGGGGVLINDKGPAAGNGQFARGGSGYGAGGGGGYVLGNHWFGGGNGTYGLVYVEW